MSLALRLGRRLEAQDEGRRQRGRPLSDVGAVVALREHLARHTLSRFFTVSLSNGVFTWDWKVEEFQARAGARWSLGVDQQHPSLTPAELVARYKDLGDIERGFRVLKSSLDLAPVHHRLPDRKTASQWRVFRGQY